MKLVTHLLLLGLVAYGANPALAADFPLRGTLIGVEDQDILNFECSVPRNGSIDCEFVQVLLSDGTNGRSLEEELSRAPDFLTEFKDQPSFCNSVLAYERVLDPDSDHSKKDTELASQFFTHQKEFKEHHPLVRQQMVGTLADVCKAPTIENAREMIAITYEYSAKTCRPMVNKYSQKFRKVSENLWVVESNPSGECGVVNTSKLFRENAEDLFWSYEATKVVTNKSESASEICRVLDENPQRYVFGTGPYVPNCVYFE